MSLEPKMLVCHTALSSPRGSGIQATTCISTSARNLHFLLVVPLSIVLAMAFEGTQADIHVCSLTHAAVAQDSAQVVL